MFYLARMMTGLSYAKINLGLRIVSKRPDGFHNIETTFKVIDLCDRITLERSNRIDLVCDDPRVPRDESNLCMRAVRQLESAVGESLPVRIALEKRIPIGGGLGGGSSNAASVLVNVRSLFELPLTDDQLMEMASRLGSDVPFFVGVQLGKGHTATGTGRGEMLEYFDWPLTEQVVLVNPGIHIDTAWAYQHYARQVKTGAGLGGSFGLTNKSKSIKFSALLAKPLFFENYFEDLVFQEHPKIKNLRHQLEEKGAKIARMSGSGSTVFGIFDSETCLDGLAGEMADCFVHIGRFVRS